MAGIVLQKVSSGKLIKTHCKGSGGYIFDAILFSNSIYMHAMLRNEFLFVHFDFS
jgi:hypothetical protein